mgnify:CR=1 FL=1
MCSCLVCACHWQQHAHVVLLPACHPQPPTCCVSSAGGAGDAAGRTLHREIGHLQLRWVPHRLLAAERAAVVERRRKGALWWRATLAQAFPTTPSPFLPCRPLPPTCSTGVVLWEICTGQTPIRGQLRDVRWGGGVSSHAAQRGACLQATLHRSASTTLCCAASCCCLQSEYKTSLLVCSVVLLLAKRITHTNLPCLPPAACPTSARQR